MNTQTMEGFRHTLLGRRRSLLRRRQHALADESELLAEREPDWEDAAAALTAASVLDGLGEVERGALLRIEYSLRRIAHGTYGTCARCGGAIEVARLRAVPDADRCARCAAAVT